MSLFTITITRENNNQITRLVFGDHTRAYKVFEDMLSADQGDFRFKDDFGHEIFYVRQPTDTILYEDMIASMNGNTEAAILQAHGQIKANKRAAQDPEIREANRQPAILDPRALNGGVVGRPQ